ncbi:putative C6 transcription factor [Lojkania enalia]|uniref:C6 transcription factor n=1 Tax=Lojkania enalia TaxID=147567 RepID=A0A9P4MZP7_9PLEO|nr:putative C6 transcription factor [Didymosphaeria enalia]
MAEPERRRRRPAVSCTLCRRRKLRCNRETPCSNCLRSKTSICVYENYSQPPQRQVDNASTISTASTPGSQVSQDFEAMRNRISQLEDQLSKLTTKTTTIPHTMAQTSSSSSSFEIHESRIGSDFFFHHESRLLGEAALISRGVTHKKRLFGQSHWVNSVIHIRDLVEMLDPYLREESSRTLHDVQRCKALGRVIKSRRAPQWPSPPTAELPSKSIADELIDCYLKTIETVYRILHIPSFRRDYEAIWTADTEPKAEFLVQLKLVLAIGALTYDEQFSMRTSAMRWTYEAQTWLAGPGIKKRLGISLLQTSILLLLARESIAIDGSFIWISTGELLRLAVYMGLHRDALRLPRRTFYEAEMRRRLWNTILELILQSSITSGGPPFISIEDFDTEPPRNLDDNQLEAEEAMPKHESEYTQTSTAIALRKTLPIRLAIAKFLNNLGSRSTYQDTLRLDAELREAYKVLCQTLQRYKSNTGQAPSDFEIRTVELIMHRYIIALHIPFYSGSFNTSTFAFSRKAVIDASMKIWYAAFPPSSMMTPASRSNTPSLHKDYLARLTTSGAGFFHIVPFQAVFNIAVELKTQLQEEENPGLGPVLMRFDLLSVLDDAKEWFLRSMRAGEVNMKCLLLLNLLRARINGFMGRVSKEDCGNLLNSAAQEALQTSLSILEEMAAQGDGFDIDSLDMSDLMEDWDLMQMNIEPMGWVFNDDTTQELSFWGRMTTENPFC